MSRDGDHYGRSPYAQYMSERMAAPDLTDWQVFLSEYVIFVAVAWLHAIYNDFCLNRLSSALRKAL